MPEERICSHCQAWLCRSDDAWCGNCGKSCAQLELLAKRAVIQLGDEPPRIFFKLTNTTCTPISVSQISCPQWLSFPEDQITQIMSGGFSGLFATADLTSILEPTSAEVIFSTSVGDVSVHVMVIDRKPQLICWPNVIETWAGPSGERGISRTSIRPAAGMLIVRDIRLRGVPGKVRAEKSQAGFAALPESGAPAEIEVQAERLGPGIQQAQLEVTFDGPHGTGTTEVPININVLRPPELRWAGEHDRPSVRHQTDRQSLALVFHNQSPDGKDGGSNNAELIIHSIDLTPPRGFSIPITRPKDLPVSVPGGQSHIAEFSLNLKQLAGTPGRMIEFGLAVRTNLPRLNGTVSLRVEPMQRFDGVVAIDFGSSNTCCAVLSPGSEPELLPLDEDSLVSPTVLLYLDLLQMPPVIETGSHVWEEAVVNLDAAASVAEGLKRKLRDKKEEIDIRPLVPRRWMSRKATDATTDYLRNLRQRAETQKRAIFENFILTHPARCPLRQHHRLSAALLQAFGSTHFSISYIPEPIAALIPYIAERARNDAKNSYAVASFDLGGGTTDVAIIQVSYEHPTPDQLEIVPIVRYCKGVDFGGEDLTDYLRAELEKRCQALLLQRDANAVVVTEHGSGAAVLDIRRNRAELRLMAEMFKASLSDESRNQELRPIRLRVKLQDGETLYYPFDFSTVRRQGGHDLATEFLVHTTDMVREVAEMLKEAAQTRNLQLDVIQLSGKTALLPVVSQAIQDIFHGVRIERALEPKECVVKGACLSRSMRIGKVRLKMSDSMEHMTSSIGVFSSQSAYFLPLLKADMEIPAEGLQRELAAFWTGSEPAVIWEDVHGDNQLIEYASAAKFLEKLGTWEPERKVDSARLHPWTLRLTVKKFVLSVEMIGPDGDCVRFHPIYGTGV